MRKNLFLYLALVCFLGLIALFIVDGYMGVYDTIYITAGEREQKIEADFWLRARGYDDRYYYDDYYYEPAVTNWGEKVFFRYEIDNRRFSTYSADIEVSVWSRQQKVLVLLSEQMQIASFDKGQLEWVVDTSELETVPPEEFVEYTIIIKRGELERRIILFFDLFLNRSSSPKIAVPAK